MSTIKSSGFWWGVVATGVALWLWRNYGNRLPGLPGGQGG